VHLGGAQLAHDVLARAPDLIDPRFYDRDLGEGACENVVRQLRTTEVH
jgi:hypothetical protein